MESKGREIILRKIKRYTRREINDGFLLKDYDILITYKEDPEMILKWLKKGVLVILVRNEEDFPKLIDPEITPYPELAGIESKLYLINDRLHEAYYWQKIIDTCIILVLRKLKLFIDTNNQTWKS